jgi:outer membrane beta-barrel protein
MTAAVALALLLGAGTESQSSEAVPTPAIAELPPVAGGSRYGAPASLPPVSAQLFHLKGMLEIQPMFSFSIGDPFWRTMAVGLRGEHHLDERWSVSGHVLGGASLLAAPITVCTDASCADPAADKLRSTPGKLLFLVGAEVGWAPVYGKLSLMGERTLHFDAYISAGPELVMERIAQDAASPEATRWAPGGRFSLGERLFIGDRFVVRMAASELVYAGRVRGHSEVERKLTIEGGLAWLFGH